MKNHIEAENELTNMWRHAKQNSITAMLYDM